MFDILLSSSSRKKNYLVLLEILLGLTRFPTVPAFLQCHHNSVLLGLILL